MNTLLLRSHQLFSMRRTAVTAPTTLRAIHPDDTEALQDFVRALSPASRRLRFHGALNELSETMLKTLTRVEQGGRAAFVLTVTERGTERIVGEACYAVSSDHETAEFGIAMADAFQGLRQADRLVKALLDTAYASGLRWLVGDVLIENSRMLAFTRRWGFAATMRGAEPGTVRVERSVDRSLPGTGNRIVSRVAAIGR